MDKRLTLQYAGLQGSYWMVYCSVFGYAAVFLLSKHFTPGRIGILMAWANVAAAVLQPWVASCADRTKRYTLKDILLLIAAAGLAPTLLLILIPGLSGAAVAVLFMMVMAAVSVMQPLVNAVSVYYGQRGRSVNFGLARGIGSLSFALISYALGFLVEKNGERVILLAITALLAVLLCVLSAFRMGREQQPPRGSKEKQTGGKAGYLLKRYRLFFALLLGVAFVFAFHNMVNTYLIQIVEQYGGGSSDMGVSIALAAVCELPAMVLFSRIVRRVGASRLLRVSACGFLIKALAIAMVRSVPMVHMTQLFQSVSFALFIPASVCCSDEIMGERDKVKGQALMTAAITIGGVGGNLLGGWLIDVSGVFAMLAGAAGCAVAGAAVIFVTAAAPERPKTREKHGI